MTYSYEFPRPGLTVDCVVFGLDASDLKIVLIQRQQPPFDGEWALPGGFVQVNESVDETALRQLRDKTGIQNVFLEQLFTFGRVDRDPGDRIVTVAYFALVNLNDYQAIATTATGEVSWFPVANLPHLPLDHAEIVATALRRLKAKVRSEPIGFELLPPKFTLTQVQKLYETILEKPLDKRNFRKKILGMQILMELNEWEQKVPHRAARLYQFNEQAYQERQQQGFNFEI